MITETWNCYDIHCVLLKYVARYLQKLVSLDMYRNEEFSLGINS